MGQILLTQEQILSEVSFNATDNPMLLNWLKKIAKAQLKNMAEWLDTLTFYEDWGGESAEDLRDYIKQTLLKEAGLEE